ncbi:MAG: tellurite resistance TerB family protein [Aulosira sp. ZfuVER01]|nr:tellurite resistance TerB family protein [Aulosira sp. ZfuVER01]MDZ8002105.1 tellurite resistance TerB family protein [Aulosira sp. DedVER01a]MDZ8052628.1 tellurite resistance TerB family protein [Aulosira sp. ZfuCHP01]
MLQRKWANRSNSSVALEPEVAIAVIGLFSAASDDEGVSRTEEFALSEMLAGISQFEDFSERDFEELTQKVYDLLEEEEPEDVIEQAIASLPDEEYREAAYITALLVVGIDGEVPDSEQDYISELQDALNITNRRAQQIIDHIFGEDDEDEYEDE